jgi:hypothetical protein
VLDAAGFGYQTPDAGVVDDAGEPQAAAGGSAAFGGASMQAYPCMTGSDSGVHSCIAPVSWSKRLVSTYATPPLQVSVASDPLGNGYLGVSWTPINWGAGTDRSGSGSLAHQLISVTPTGELRWGKVFKASFLDASLAVDSDRKVCMVCAGGSDDDPTLLEGAQFGLNQLRCFDLDGNPLWRRPVPLGTREGKLAFDSAGNAYYTGASGAGAQLIESYAPDGSERFSVGAGDADADRGVALLALSDDSFAWLGTLSSHMTFGDVSLTAEEPEIVVARFDPNGRLLWAQTFADTSRVAQLAITEHGVIAVVTPNTARRYKLTGELVSITVGQAQGVVGVKQGFLTARTWLDSNGRGEIELTRRDEQWVPAWTARYGANPQALETPRAPAAVQLALGSSGELFAAGFVPREGKGGTDETYSNELFWLRIALPD